jgi:hypothetical protein
MSNARVPEGFKFKFTMRPLKKIMLGYWCLMLLAFALPLSHARAEGSLIASEVNVDVTGSDTANAREEAMAKGQTEALAELLGKFTTSDQVQQIMTNLDPQKVSAMVRGTEVLNEKMSTNRYRATLKISFDANEVSKLIGNSGGNGEAVKPTPTGAFLIIPSYEEGSTTLLWDDGNPWRNAWKATGIAAIAGDIIVPYGDKADSAVIDVKTLPSATFSSLQPMTVRYGVTDIVLLHAKFLPSAETTLEVVKRRISRTQNEVNVLTYRADPQENREALMARATHDIVDSLEHTKIEEVQSVKAVYEGDHASIMVLVSISTLSSWTQLRAKLSTLPMIDKLEPLAISPQQVDLMIHYRGPADSLANAITAQNIRLIKNPNYWTISRD